MFRKILVWFSGMLLFSSAAFFLTWLWLSPRSPAHDDLMRRLVDFQFSEAVGAYERGGPAALRDFISRLNRDFPVHHHLVDDRYRDLATGEDLSEAAREAISPRHFWQPPPSYFLVRSASAGTRYALLIQAGILPDPWSGLPVYGWILLAVVLLCYVLAWTLAKPIRQLREAVVRFGRGDLSLRTNWRRRDEIGDLARSFDQMADRIETLLTAERRLLQDISHELRSPLTRLRLAVELARSRPTLDDALARVDKEVDRLSRLVGELLQMTRAEGDPTSRDVSRFEALPFLQALVDDAHIEAEARGCSISLNVKGDIVLAGDRELLHRAVENVVRNAIHHSPRGTTIEVDATTANGLFELRVRDYGPGVSQELLTKIFQPFFRVEEDRGRDDGGGIGLGLAIAERAVRLHNGRILARNMSPGLLVEIALPLQV